MRRLIVGVLLVAILGSLVSMVLFWTLPHPTQVVTGKTFFNAVLGVFSLFIEGETRSINITSPLNVTYSFAIGANLTLDLNASASFNATTWKYSLYDERHGYYVAQQVVFTPNATFTAVRWNNRLEVYANVSGTAEVVNENVSFSVFVPNSAPLVTNISNLLLACEASAFSKFFNVTDVDEDSLSVSISPSAVFFVIPSTTTAGKVISSIELFSGTLSKARVGNYSRIISVNDGEYVDNKQINITVIEINNAPSLTNPGVHTVWTMGQNSTFYHQLQLDDLESGNNASTNFTYNITFLEGAAFFNISNQGILNVSPNASQVGNYNISVCATDQGLVAKHPNISICGQTGANITVCAQFLLTVTNQNRAPNITNFYPSPLLFNADSATTLTFNMTVSDPDGTIVDTDWFIDGEFIQRDSSSLIPSLEYAFSCDSSGLHSIEAITSDGLINASVEWNVTLTAVSCATPAGGGGAGGGGGGGASASPSSCLPKWGCSDWGICVQTNSSYLGGNLSEQNYSVINASCSDSSYDAVSCGYQIRSCIDTRNCTSVLNNPIKKPAQIQSCQYVSVPSCFDGVTNCHDNLCEVLADCGGPCNACASCSDGVQNQGETGVDCGGPCPGRCEVQRVEIDESWLQYILIAIVILLIVFIVQRLYRISQLRNSLQKKK